MPELKEREEAAYILDALLGSKREKLPEIQDMEISIPELQLARKAVLLIEKQGGKVDAALVGMLSSAGMLQELLSKQSGISEEERNEYEERRAAARLMADELVNRNLVELPVVARGRGRG